MEEILPSLPFRIEIEVINKCNLKCDYCYAAPFDNFVMPPSNLKYIISKTEVQVMPFEVVFLGGEPFLRQDMIDILEYANSTFSTDRVSVSTNGTMFKSMEKNRKEKILKLKALSTNNSIIQVSIDSTINLNIDKSIKSFEGIKVLERNKISFSVGIVLTQRNYSDLSKTICDLSDLSYLRSINLEVLQKINDLHYTQYQLTDAQLSIIPPMVKKVLREKGREDICVVGLEDVDTYLKQRILMRNVSDIELQDRKITNAGIYTNGNVSMNGVMDRKRIVGNIFHQDWKEIWKTANKMYRKEKETVYLTKTKSRD